jgi:hypothetical protein
MRRQPRLATVAALVLTLGYTVSCGGSASETPFPQPPIEHDLAARHDTAHAADDVAPAPTLGVSASISASSSAPALSASVANTTQPAAPSGSTASPVAPTADTVPAPSPGGAF